MSSHKDRRHSSQKPTASWLDLIKKLFTRRQRSVPTSPGAHWEDRAARFIEKKGFRILARNVRTRRGEIDIVAADGDEIVFVEVKQRKTDEFGGGEYAIDYKKRYRLLRAAEEFLSREGLTRTPCRFDTIIINTGVDPPQFSHTQNAFGDQRR